MDVRLKTVAVIAWLAGLALTLLTITDAARWVIPAAVGCYAAAATLTVLVGAETMSRHTRRAFYHQRRWDDDPDAAILHLLRRPDAVDSPAERTVARRGSPSAS
jgi:hypothetical protein